MRKSELREIIKEELSNLSEDFGDVYTVMASSSSIRLLMKIPGVSRNDITTRMDYNAGRWPKKEHHARIKSWHIQEFGPGAQKMAHDYVKKLPKIEGVYYYVQN